MAEWWDNLELGKGSQNNTNNSLPKQIWDDADSSSNLRLRGADAPEIFHNITPTGDTNNERSKVYKQIADLNNISIEDAIKQVDSEAAEELLDPNIGLRIKAKRAAGKYTGPITSHEIYQLGKEATMATNEAETGKFTDRSNLFDKQTSFNDTQETPEQLETPTYNSLEKGHFGRGLVDLDTSDEMIANGYMLPGTAPDTLVNKKKYELEAKAADKAKRLGIGGWSDPTQAKIMQSIADTSYVQKIADSSGIEGDKSYLDQIISLPQAISAGLTKSAYDTADTYTDLAGDVIGKGVGLISKETGEYIDKNVDLGTDKEKTERVNSLIGYDNSFTKRNMEKVSELYDEAMEDVKLFSPSTWLSIKPGSLAKSVGTAFKDIETAGYSLGYMVPALYGVAGKAAKKVSGAAVSSHLDLVTDNLKEVAKGNMTKKAAKESAKESLKTMSKRDRTKLFLVNNADVIQYGANMNNNQMDDYIEANGGEEATVLRNILGTAANSVGMKMDIGVLNSILKPSKSDTGAVIGSWIAGMNKNKARVVVAKMAEYTARAAAAGVKEFPQELTQTFIEEFNKIYGTKKESGGEVGASEAANIARNKAVPGAIAGLAGGTHTSLGVTAVTKGPGAVLNGVASGLNYVSDAIDSSINERAESKRLIKEAKVVKSRTDTLSSNGIDYEAYTEENRVDNPDAEAVTLTNKDGEDVKVNMFEDPNNIKIDSKNDQEYHDNLELQKQLVINSLYKVDPKSGDITGLSEEADNMSDAELDARKAKVNTWLKKYASEYTPKHKVDKEVLDTITEEAVVHNELSDTQYKELLKSANNKFLEGKGIEGLTNTEKIAWTDDTEVGTERRNKVINELTTELDSTPINEDVKKFVDYMNSDKVTYHVDQRTKASKIDAEEAANAEKELKAAQTELDELSGKTEEETSAEDLDKIEELKETVANRQAELDSIVEEQSFANSAADNIVKRDIDKVKLKNLTDDELEQHYNIELTEKATDTVDGKVVYKNGFTKKDIDSLSKAIVQRTKEIATQYKFDEDIEAEPIYDGLTAKVIDAKQKKNKVVDSLTVNGNKLVQLIKDGVTPEAIEKSGIQFDENSSKLAKRVFGKIGVSGKSWTKAVETMDKIVKAVEDKETKSELSKIMSNEAIADGDGTILLTVAMSAINSAVTTDTESRQTVDNSNSLLKKEGYWAGRAGLEAQVGKDLLTAKKVKLVRGTPEQHAEQYRKIGSIALDALVKAGLAEETEGAMWSVVSDEAVTAKGEKLTKENSRAAVTDNQTNAITDKKVLIFANDKGIRIVGDKTTNENRAIKDDGLDTKLPYINEVGDLIGRIGKLLTPGNTQSPSKEASTDPIVTSPTVKTFKNDSVAIEDTIKKMQNTDMELKDNWKEFFTKINKEVVEYGEGSLDTYLSSTKGAWVADMLGITKYNTQSEILAYNDAGVSNGIKDALRNILDNLDGLKGEFYYTYQVDKNNRVTVRENTLNFQSDNVIARHVLQSGGIGKDGYDMGAPEYVFETQVEMLNQAGFKAPKGSNEAEIKAAYEGAIDIILNGGKPANPTAGEKIAMEIRDLTESDITIRDISTALNDKTGTMYSEFGGKKTIKGISLIDGFKVMRESKGKRTTFVTEADAKASGVMNVLMNILGFDETVKEGTTTVQELLETLGVELNGSLPENISSKDAYNLLQNKVVEVLKLTGNPTKDKNYAEARATIESLKNLVGVDTRELSKSPVMTWFYTAGSDTIVNELTQTLLENVVRKAVEGDAGAIKHLNELTGKKMNRKDVERIKIGDPDYTKIREAYNTVGKLYNSQLEAAFPGVVAFKEEMKTLFELIEKDGYGDGVLDSSAQAVYGGEGRGTFNIHKEKMYEVDLENNIDDKPELQKAKANKKLVTANKSFGNFTSVIPLLAQGVDFTILEKTVRALYKKHEGKGDFGPMTVHDAIYLAYKYMKEGRMDYNRTIVDVARRYDFVDTMLNYGDDTVKRMEKAIKNMQDGAEKSSLITAKNYLATELAQRREANGKRQIYKTAKLRGVKVKLFGEVEMKVAKSDDVETKPVAAVERATKLSPEESLMDIVNTSNPFEGDVEKTLLDGLNKYTKDEFGNGTVSTLDDYAKALGADANFDSIIAALQDKNVDLNVLADPKEAAKKVQIKEIFSAFRSTAKKDSGKAVTDLLSSLVNIGNDSAKEINSLIDGKTITWNYDVEGESGIVINTDKTGKSTYEINIGKESKGSNELTQMIDVIGHEVEHAVTAGKIEELAEGKGSEKDLASYKYLSKVLDRIEKNKDQVRSKGRLRRILNADGRKNQIAELVAVVKGEPNGGTIIAQELQDKGIVSTIANKAIESVKSLIASIRASMNNDKSFEYGDEINIETMLRAIEDIHDSSIEVESYSDGKINWTELGASTPVDVISKVNEMSDGIIEVELVNVGPGYEVKNDYKAVTEGAPLKEYKYGSSYGKTYKVELERKEGNIFIVSKLNGKSTKDTFATVELDIDKLKATSYTFDDTITANEIATEAKKVLEECK